MLFLTLESLESFYDVRVFRFCFCYGRYQGVQYQYLLYTPGISKAESEIYDSAFPGDERGSFKPDDLLFHCVGFESAAPVFTLHTHIWALLCFRTLYRTVSGMMNYAEAIKSLTVLKTLR
jgi:1,3-beta-glucan synthase